MMIEALEDADGPGVDGVGEGAVEALGVQALEDPVVESGCSVDAELECGWIGRAGTVQVTGGDLVLSGQFGHFCRDAVN